MFQLLQNLSGTPVKNSGEPAVTPADNPLATRRRGNLQRLVIRDRMRKALHALKGWKAILIDTILKVRNIDEVTVRSTESGMTTEKPCVNVHVQRKR